MLDPNSPPPPRIPRQDPHAYAHGERHFFRVCSGAHNITIIGCFGSFMGASARISCFFH